MSCNTKLIHIQIIFMHTFLCFDFRTPTASVHVPLCARLTVISQKSKQKIDADIYSTHYTYKYIHANYKQSIIKQISKSTQNTYKIFMYF
jgi:hypothetical protein